MEKESQLWRQDLSWRPGLNIAQRAIRAAKCLFQTPHASGCLTLATSFTALSALMCETDLSELKKAKRQAIGKFIDLTIYTDLVLDPITSRTSRGRDGLIRFERFNRFPEKIERFERLAKKAEHSDPITNSAIKWFNENRVLNFALFATFRNNGTIPWDRYLTSHTDRFYQKEPISQSEKDYFEKVKSALENWNPDHRAILLRALSSVSYAHALLCLTEQSSDINLGKLRRLASMIDILQVIDDFATASEDEKDEINGIIAGSLNEEEINRLSPERMKEVVAIAKGTICGCLDVVGIDPNRKWKKQIARLGILTISAAAAFWMSKRHGRTPYPPIPTAKAIIREILTPTDENDPHRILARKALEIGLGFFHKDKSFEKATEISMPRRQQLSIPAIA